MAVGRLFVLQQRLAGYGAWDLVLLGAVAVAVTLFARGLWGGLTARAVSRCSPIGHRAGADARSPVR